MGKRTKPEKHPMQPVVLDQDKVARFKKNKIVEFLLDAGKFNMNDLAMMNFTKEDRSQFAQLIGYSVSGFGDLSYADKEHVKTADWFAANLT